MKRLVLCFLVFFACHGIFGQSKNKNQDVEIIDHEVQLGESVRLISKKYLVDPAEIYKLNKFAVNGISQGMVLKIPVPRKTASVAQQEEPLQNTEPVAETTADKPVEKTISEKPVISKTVKKVDPEITSVVTGNETAAPVVIERTSDTHTVIPKETLYSLSKRYGITVDELKAANPELQQGLKVGQVIKIPAQSTTNQTSVAVGSQTDEASKPTVTSASENTPSAAESSQTADELITHVVAAKETLYSLSKKYNVTVAEIKEQNQALLQKGLQIGQTLTIRKH